jgi:uncharacterized membrane protein
MSAPQLISWLILVLLLAAAFILWLRSRRSTAASHPPVDYHIFGDGVRDVDQYWLFNGFLYNNPDDPALFVVNRWGLGITPNLAHPFSVRIAIGFLVALALIPIILILFFPGFNTASHHPGP